LKFDNSLSFPRRILRANDKIISERVTAGANMPEEREQRERLLRRAVLAGNEHAWRTWYDAEFAGLHAYALWRCGGMRDLADEIVQDAWLTAIRRIRAFDPAQGSFAGWLRGIVAHLLRNRLRQQATRNGKPLRVPELPAPPADAELQAREQAERVARTLAGLPERYEAVLRAKYLEGRSVHEIAATSGETDKAIESLLTRARQAFRDAFDQGDMHHDHST
jgi:RNA polymerase sigma-70 factor (ECF subfamily)